MAPPMVGPRRLLRWMIRAKSVCAPLAESSKEQAARPGTPMGTHSRLAKLAKWSGADAVAVDYSKESIEQIEEIFEANGCEVKSVFADIMQWDSDGRKFDLIVHWGLVEHFEDPVPLLKKCADLLAPGGTLLFSMPNMEAWGAYIWRRFSASNWSKHIFPLQAFVSLIIIKLSNT